MYNTERKRPRESCITETFKWWAEEETRKGTGRERETLFKDGAREAKGKEAFQGHRRWKRIFIGFSHKGVIGDTRGRSFNIVVE